MRAYKKYIEKISILIDEIVYGEEKNIDLLGTMMADTIERKNSIFVFGASHAGIITEELFYRAGGLALINPILEPSMMLNMRPITFTSKMERLEGYGREIANKTNFQKGDLLIIHSVSGRNCVSIDLALSAKEKGVEIVAITNLSYSKQVSSRHSSGKRLFEVANLVIDNHGDIGDACVEVEGLSQKVAPTSTIAASLLMNAVIADVAEKLILRGITPPFFYSANIDGGDEHNNKIFDEYKNNIFYM